MKTFTDLYFFVLLSFCAVFTGCGDELKVLDIVDDVAREQTDTIISDWQYRPEKNITLNFPEWLKDGSQGQIGLGEAHPHAPDESFELEQWHALFHEGYIYIPDHSATHVYVFDMNGDLLMDKTMVREIILGGRASPLAPHIGNVSLEGEFLRKTHPDMSVADFVRSVKAEGNRLVIEIGWWPGYATTWITRVGFLKSTTTYWDLSTGEITFGGTVEHDCWIDYQDETGKRWAGNTWCDTAEQEQAEIDANNGIKPIIPKLLFSTGIHDYVFDNNTDDNGYYKGYAILTKQGSYVGHFNPDELVIGKRRDIRFSHGIYYENTLYMLAQTVPHNDIDTQLGIDPYTFYAFQQN